MKQCRRIASKDYNFGTRLSNRSPEAKSRTKAGKLLILSIVSSIPPSLFPKFVPCSQMSPHQAGTKAVLRHSRPGPFKKPLVLRLLRISHISRGNRVNLFTLRTEIYRDKHPKAHPRERTLLARLWIISVLPSGYAKFSSIQRLIPPSLQNYPQGAR